MLCLITDPGVMILIHTSVKLVTSPHYEVLSVTDMILIHTSVKLVTKRATGLMRL